MTIIPPQPPDDSTGRRYARAFKYVFAMLRPGDDLSQVDPNEGTHDATSLVDEGRFVALTLPQEISLHEPYATVVTVMQDGGKLIETRGQVLKTGTVSGTTGFLPPNRQGSPIRPPFGRLVPNLVDVDGALGQISGYLAFQKLRYLFRLYGDQRRRGDLDVELHFFDYKNDDFWRIEPESFDMRRSNRRPMSYDYNIQFKCIEFSDSVVTRDQEIGAISGSAPFIAGSARAATNNIGGVLTKVAGASGATSKQGVFMTVSRFAELTTSGLDFLKHCDAVVQRAFQVALSRLADVVGFFQNFHDTFFTLIDLAPALLVQLSAAVTNLFNTMDALAPDNIAQELNAWGLETQTLADHLAVQVDVLAASQPQRDVKDTDARFSQGRMRRGATTDLMQEPSGSSGSLDANPFIGTSGLALVTDVDGLASNAQCVMTIINVGEDIYAVARRVLGDISRFIDLVLLNQLEFPFIVADATSRPANTLAWGDRMRVPATAALVGEANIVDTTAPSGPPSTAGTVSTAGLPSQLIDDTVVWLPDQWRGYSVTVSTGGLTQTLVAGGNTADGVLTLSDDWTIAITPGTTTYVISYNVFNPRRPLTPDARAYGVDLLVVFGSDGRADLALGATADLAAAEGVDNLIQAITLRARCPLGSHPFHPAYGLPAPIGRPATDAVFALNAFFTRRSLLSDPRVSKVRNVQFDLVGGTLTLSAEIQPTSSRLSRLLSVPVGV